MKMENAQIYKLKNGNWCEHVRSVRTKVSRDSENALILSYMVRLCQNCTQWTYDPQYQVSYSVVLIYYIIIMNYNYNPQNSFGYEISLFQGYNTSYNVFV